MITLKKQVKWRRDKNALLICDCKRLIDLKLSFKYESFLRKLLCGLDPDALGGDEALIFSEFEKMDLLCDLKIIQLPEKDFHLAMNILDDELRKNRVRDPGFLRKKFKENIEFFIGIYLAEQLVGVICGFPREDYLLMSEIAIDFRFQRRKFGERLVKEFERIAFRNYSRIHAGALDDAIEFYKSLNYKPFLLVQFEKGIYNKNDFLDFKVLKLCDNCVELEIKDCSIEELNKLRSLYPKASLQYIFVKTKGID